MGLTVVLMGRSFTTRTLLTIVSMSSPACGVILLVGSSRLFVSSRLLVFVQLHAFPGHFCTDI
jgi:hypothetical protein